MLTVTLQERYKYCTQSKRKNEEYQQDERVKMVYSLNAKRIGRQLRTLLTVMARDFKGFGTGLQLQNGVIEWIRNKM